MLVSAAILSNAGCSSTPPPESASPPPAPPETGAADTRPFVSGADDSVASIPGTPGAPYYYRFQMISPSGERFSFQDRDLSFYFKPAPDAVHFQVENRQNRPVWIDWERSVFYDPVGASGEVAHSTTRFEDRFQTQTQTQVPGQGRYSDYLLPLSYLIDPAGSTEQLHRPLLPEDTTSPQYKDQVFGADLVFLVEDRPRTYSIRFRVASVIAR